MIVVTEGEIDCLSVAELQKCKWPVVSIPTGAPSAKKALAANLEYQLLTNEHTPYIAVSHFLLKSSNLGLNCN
jgi:hypothetical protein